MAKVQKDWSGKMKFASRSLLLPVMRYSSLPLLVAQVPPSSHVVVVVEENHSYSSVIGNSAMPYLNRLASRVRIGHPVLRQHASIDRQLLMFMMTVGQIITNNDSYTGTVTADNLVRHLLSAGKTWKSYAENLPYAGYTGGDSGPYVRHHNPFSYLSDVVNSSVQKLNLRALRGGLRLDLSSNDAPA